MVDEVFQSHENRLRQQIRANYRVETPDTSKLRKAIEELEGVLAKLAHVNTVMPALKKCLLLDHRSLIDYFSPLRQAQPKPNAESFFYENPTISGQIKTALERIISMEDYETFPKEQPQPVT